MAKPKTIYAYLKGGLGNQLFIYAANRSLALHHGARLLLDCITGFHYDLRYRRGYELESFALTPEVYLINKLDRNYLMRRRLWRRAKWLRPWLRRYYWRDSFHGGPDSLRTVLLNEVRTDGYWTDECYFVDHIEKIRQELIIQRPLHPRNQDLAQQLREEESAAIHLRQVDYGSVLDIGYYNRALAWLSELAPQARLYCFSDDLEQCQALFGKRYALTFMDNRDCPAIEDFHLMTCCKHFVIANSTYSWWAAWLGERKGSIVLAPEPKAWQHINPALSLTRWHQVPVTMPVK